MGVTFRTFRDGDIQKISVYSFKKLNDLLWRAGYQGSLY